MYGDIKKKTLKRLRFFLQLRNAKCLFVVLSWNNLIQRVPENLFPLKGYEWVLLLRSKKSY